MLVRLMYASRAARPLDPEELLAIQRHATTHNPKVGVTGVLCFADEVFIQVLEGGRAAVSTLYQRIAADPRHHDVTLLAYEEIGERRFAGWAMGRVNLARVNPALLLKYSPTPKLDPFAVAGKVTLALFDELVATAAIGCLN
jgi:hypothetical protein